MPELAGIDCVERSAMTAGEEEQSREGEKTSFETRAPPAPQDDGFV
jgi:hypothetical protein